MLRAVLVLFFFSFTYLDAIPWDTTPPKFEHEMIIDPETYNDDDLPTLSAQLWVHIKKQPINLLFTLYFILAIIHTFWAHRFSMAAKRGEKEQVIALGKEQHGDDRRLFYRKSFWGEIQAFIGEVEVVFGLWCIPLLASITLFYDWSTALDYVEREDYKIPLFIVVSVAIASSLPFVRFVEVIMGKIAKFGGGSITAWWLSIMTFGPLLGSLVKETVAMTITAVLLGRNFYRYGPKKELAYLTLAMLFIHISVGGLCSNFASTAVAVVAKHWGWSSLFMFQSFGWKALLGILVSNIAVVFYYKQEFNRLEKKASQTVQEELLKVPVWIMLTHVFMLAWIVLNYNSPVIAMGSFVLFLGFYQATASYQKYLNLREPILVAFFVAGISLHAGLQIWWIDPLISHLNNFWAMKVTVVLSAFNNNTSVNYLMTHIPELTDSLRYALVSGAMIGAGFTILANGPNLVGYSLLEKHFDYNLSPWKLFLAALAPTLIMYVAFSIT